MMAIVETPEQYYRWSCKIVDMLVERYPGQEFSVAHVVLSDYNFDDNCLISSLDRGMKWLRHHADWGTNWSDYPGTRDEIWAVCEALVSILARKHEAGITDDEYWSWEMADRGADDSDDE